MRRFFSYGPVNTKLHYYAPREELIKRACIQLIGENPTEGEGGHYITIWAPRQCGKTWVMQQVLFRLKKEAQFDVLKINLEHLKYEENTGKVMEVISKEIGEGLNKNFTRINTQAKFQEIFKKGVLAKPLILILDEFDALSEKAVHTVVSAFRNIHIKRTDEMTRTTEQKSYLLHAVALIGVRSVLGIENAKGSPFNVQRSVHIPDLTFEEVENMFRWYEKESGQTVEPEVINALFDETRGQPGLTCWFGELLTEGFEDYKIHPDSPITMRDFEIVYAAATYALPNNNILNIISKAKEEDNKRRIFDMFQTGEKLEFRFDDPTINALYMNGIADKEVEDQTRYYVRFSCPFIQKRLFNYFSHELFNYMGSLVDPFDTLEDAITEESLNPGNIIRRYNAYLVKNRDWLLKDAPRRKDMGIYEAVFHFNMYMYLYRLLKSKGARVFPQFPTGNGKIDIVITYKERVYGIELKSYTDYSGYKTALEQAARYGKQLSLKEVLLVFFVEAIDRETREKYEARYRDESSGVTVVPVFVATGK